MHCNRESKLVHRESNARFSGSFCNFSYLAREPRAGEERWRRRVAKLGPLERIWLSSRLQGISGVAGDLGIRMEKGRYVVGIVE